MSSRSTYAGRRVTVMGLGAFGGGLGAVRFLLDQGAVVTLTDLRSPEQLADSLRQFDPARLHQLVLGQHREQDFVDADLLVVSPAVRRDTNRYLKLAGQAGVPLTSEMSLFWERCRGQVIAVTGSVGKSTTATLIHDLLRAAGKSSRLGGNIGVSLLPVVDRISPDEWIVLELSSFQLADLDRLQPQPAVTVVTNFFPNHLDWHGTLDSYRSAKQAICRWQQPGQCAVLNADDPDVTNWPTAARTIRFGRTLADDQPGILVLPDRLLIRRDGQEWGIGVNQLAPGLRMPHHLMNVAAALAAVRESGVIATETAEVCAGLSGDIAPVLLNFQSLPHRLTPVAEIEGRLFVNDSKATTPEASIAALNSFDRPVVLIAGGKDKEVDLGVFAREIVHRTKGVVLLGQTANAIAATLSSAGMTDWEVICTLDEAVQAAWNRSRPGDVILLSPGCASDSPFLNYEQRGERFVEQVRALAQRIFANS